MDKSTDILAKTFFLQTPVANFDSRFSDKLRESAVPVDIKSRHIGRICGIEFRHNFGAHFKRVSR